MGRGVLQDVDEACVDQVRGVDCEDGGEGDGGGVGRGVVDGHGVDFVGDEVYVMALAEAHICFQGSCALNPGQFR